MLRCPVEIFETGKIDVQHATVVNLSSRGVYFVSGEAFAPGGYLQCRIEITPPGYSSAHGTVCLDCTVEVVRVERIPDGYGVGCRISGYALRRLETPAASHVEDGLSANVHHS